MLPAWERGDLSGGEQQLSGTDSCCGVLMDKTSYLNQTLGGAGFVTLSPTLGGAGLDLWGGIVALQFLGTPTIYPPPLCTEQRSSRRPGTSWKPCQPGLSLLEPMPNLGGVGNQLLFCDTREAWISPAEPSVWERRLWAGA